MKELVKGVMPGSGHSVVYKSPKKDQKSYKVTSQLLNNLWEKAGRIRNKVKLILTIPANNKENYVLTCYLTKEKS